ncbi:MAG TPA: UDP-N-acetylglucosamine 2-epimerase (non-hydrolyzing) [Pseudomonas sp.]
MHIAFVLGTRPEIIKLSSLIKACQVQRIDYTLIHTNQHYSSSMDACFFEELALPAAHFNLGVGACPPASQVGRMLVALEPLLNDLKPDHVVVQGDTNSALAGGLAANKAGFSVAHVEAGLRSFDRSMPEESNRVLLDHLASHWFCPAERQVQLLAREGIAGPGVQVTGNTGVDATLLYAARAIRHSQVLELFGLQPGNYLLLTCHRPSNTDDLSHFSRLMSAIEHLAQQRGQVVIFPCHPRLSAAHHAILATLPSIRCCEPQGYLDTLALLQQSSLLLTDSGGLQEEAYVLGLPCMVLRNNTERPETLENGGACLVQDISPEVLCRLAAELEGVRIPRGGALGDGLAYQHILGALLES